MVFICHSCNYNDTTNAKKSRYFELFVETEMRDHELDIMAAQYILIPSYGCSGCLRTAISLMQSDTLKQSFFVSYMENDSAEHYFQVNEQNLNSLYLGVEGKPIVLQYLHGSLDTIFGIDVASTKSVELVIDFDQYLQVTKGS